MEQQVQHGQQWLETLLGLMGFSASINPMIVDEQDALQAPETKNNSFREPSQSFSETSPSLAAETNSCWLAIDTANLSETQTQLLIGERGENIDAIQYLANTLLNLSLELQLQGSFTIEINGYRVQRYQELKTLAQQAVEQARETGQEVEMTQLSSAERRQIHSLLQDSEDIQTESRGQEPDRRLVVKLR